MVYYLLQISSSTHYLIIEVFYNQRFNFSLFFFTGYWIIFFSIFVCHACHAGTTTPEEASKTSNIVHKIINKSCNPLCVEKVLIMILHNCSTKLKFFKLKLFSQQLQHIKPSLRNRFFVIDWTLMFSVNLL